MPLDIGQSGRIKNLYDLSKTLRKEDIASAIETYESLNGQIESYEDSTTYDLVVNENHYPPKVIFGIALSKSINEEILSHHFVGGEDSPCFKRLRELGYTIEPKDLASLDSLVLHKEYTREDISRILDPQYKFVKGGGRWGITGIINNKPNDGDVVIITTIGNYDGNPYKDSITEDGYLRWQSQKQQKPTDKSIIELSEFDSSQNNLHLFLRTSEGVPYTYMGTLTFHDWDPLSTKPVNFIWRLNSGALQENVIKKINLLPSPSILPSSNNSPTINHACHLSEKSPPVTSKRSTPAKTTTSTHKNYADLENRNHKLGLAGELLVIEHEKERLRAAGKQDLAEKVLHIAATNSSAGYDVLSYTTTGTPKRIEVKTTTYGAKTPFFISPNEIKVSSEAPNEYWIYRIYDYQPNREELDYYALQGSVEDNFELVPNSYRAIPK